MVVINRDMVPMKGHYFFFNAGTAPLVPYLPTYAKQLGFSPKLTGIIYTILPIFGLIVKPLFGAIGDRFHKHKFLFILFQAVTIAGFVGIYFIPKENNTKVDLTCGDGDTFFYSSFAKNKTKYACASSPFVSDDKYASCQMDCEINNAYMWQTICEHWKLPNYCYNVKNEFKFTSIIPKNLISVNNTCALFHINKTVMTDGFIATPKCQYVPEQKIKCSVYCPDKRVESLNSDKQFDMICNRNDTYFSTCGYLESTLNNFIKSFDNQTDDLNCTTVCNFKDSLEWAHICDGWKADMSNECKANLKINTTHVSFVGYVNIQKILEEWPAVFFKLDKIDQGFGYHYPRCPSLNYTLPHFETSCDAKCNNSKINDIITNANIEKQDEGISHGKFWPFFIFMSLNWIGMAVVVSIGDAICFEKLGDRPQDYGQQRLWGSFGWGIFSLVTGLLIDKFSGGSEVKNYVPAFILMLIFMAADICISYYLHYSQKKMSINIFKNVGVLFSSWQTVHFLLWIILVGICTGLQWQFLFWYLENLASTSSCDQMEWMKTLQGLVNGIQCFGGEIPFFFISGTILRRIGHLNSMTLVLMGFGLRFILYSLLTNSWWVLPIELFQGITFGMFYTTMASYASLISPPGIEATVMGLVGAVFEGIGTSLGSLIGGIVFEQIGGAMTFRIFGCMSLVACLINIALVACKVFKELPPKESQYSSIIRYREDDVNFVEDENNQNTEQYQ